LRVFVAGGTGVVGRRAVTQLVKAGHDVSVIVRSDDKAATVQSMGASPVRVSLFDAPALAAAVVGHDAVMNLATHVPSPTRAAKASAWQENSRIRSEGSRNLVDAAMAANASRFVQESICFLYADGGADWLDEDAPIAEPVPDAAKAVFAAEAQAGRFTKAGGTGVVLRFGYFHAAGSSLDDVATLVTRFGRVGVFGPDDAYYPLIHADDAAAAAVAALDAPPGIYNVVDDAPATRRGYAQATADALGDTRHLRLPPAAVTRYASAKVGPYIADSMRVSNRRFREATGWAPAYPSVIEAMAQIIESQREPHRVRSGLAALLLVFLALGSIGVGLWAQVFPQSFYDSFPGLGGAWVAGDGPFNEHLVRDVGGLNLALALVLVVAAATMLVPMVRAVAIAYLVYGVPHLLYHLGHLSHLTVLQRVANLVTLGAAVVASVVILWLSRGARRRA
jgi:nucleoside-diphosphate-sugar epimerase